MKNCCPRNGRRHKAPSVTLLNFFISIHFQLFFAISRFLFLSLVQWTIGCNNSVLCFAFCLSISFFFFCLFFCFVSQSRKEIFPEGQTFTKANFTSFYLYFTLFSLTMFSCFIILCFYSRKFRKCKFRKLKFTT
jgi:hypothetical protein